MAVLTSHWNLVPLLAHNLGFAEAAIRLLLTPLIGLPLAYIHRSYLYNQSPTLKHVFNVCCGMSLAYFNYGFDVKHSAITVLLNYLMLHIVGGTQISVAISFLINMGYLLISYAIYSTDDYDMTWTTPQCVMTLRMIGLAFDLYDGHKPVGKLTNDQKTSCISKAPSLLEIYAFTYFFGGFFVGPQFPLRRYLDHIHGRLIPSDDQPPQCVQASLHLLKWGLFYCLVIAVIVPFYPNSYLFSPEFTDATFLYKTFVVAVWGHLAFVKYCLIWCLFDSVCVMTGMTYNGKDSDGNALWDTYIAIKAWDYEKALSMREVIASMNISTNVWFAKYVYKRLKFLGNRYISQICTLAFIAVWHGLYVGYYITFAFEMVVVNFEQQMTIVVKKIPTLRKLTESERLKVHMYIIRKACQLEYCGYVFVSITFLTWRKIKVVHGALYYYPYFLFFGWPVLYFGILVPYFKNMEKEKKQRESGESISAAKSKEDESNGNGAKNNLHTTKAD